MPSSASAPVALFAYNRPEHLARAMKALLRCEEVASSPFLVFCDGPKSEAGRAKVEETRKVARALAPPHARIVERIQNLGLAASIKAGVSALCDEHGRAIVLEDDLEVSPSFLRYMNDGLVRYEREPTVMQISGYMFPVDVPAPGDALFMSMASSWGWAVWKRSWDQLGQGASWFGRLEREPALRRRFDLDGAFPYFAMLQAQQRGEIDSWAIGWYLDVFAAGGISLYPRHSLVANRGHDGSGTHRERSSPFEADAHAFVPVHFPEPRIDEASSRAVREFIRRSGSAGLVSRAKRLLKHLASRVGGPR